MEARNQKKDTIANSTVHFFVVVVIAHVIFVLFLV